MLHLALKAFAPSAAPFPLLNVDTNWKFPETYPFRDRTADAAGMKLIVQVNREGAARGIGPFTHGAKEHTRVMKSDALDQALQEYGFDALIDGARGDEERFRARGRVGLSNSRSRDHQKVGGGGPTRVFPLADFNELDVWRYIALEGIEVPALYFAALRPVVERGGLLIVRADPRMELKEGEEEKMRSVRFRTLGCWPLTGAVESVAADLPGVLREVRQAGASERLDRVVDQDGGPPADDQGAYF